jgi:heme/flavin dehydrogenase (mycofactocin system)
MAPTGVHAVHPDGEVAVARAAARAGTAIALSNFASKPVEQVVAADPQTFFQVAWTGTRRDIVGRIERARGAGVVGLIATLDWSFSHGLDAGAPSVPASLDLRTVVQHAPEGMRHPRWLAQFARSGALPDLSVPNIALADERVPTFLEAYDAWRRTPPPTWSDVRWLREQWDGPFMLKGVMRVDDARRAVDAGFSAISVSNHGASSLDGTPASIRALPGVVAAVGEEIEVLLDGGIRRGGDVVKALSLGARAVMIGRAYLWGLAAGGQVGVEDVLYVLREGVDATLRALGRTSMRELSSDDVIVPSGFGRVLGDVPAWGQVDA